MAIGCHGGAVYTLPVARQGPAPGPPVRARRRPWRAPRPRHGQARLAPFPGEGQGRLRGRLVDPGGPEARAEGEGDVPQGDHVLDHVDLRRAPLRRGRREVDHQPVARLRLAQHRHLARRGQPGRHQALGQQQVDRVAHQRAVDPVAVAPVGPAEGEREVHHPAPRAPPRRRPRRGGGRRARPPAAVWACEDEVQVVAVEVRRDDVRQHLGPRGPPPPPSPARRPRGPSARRRGPGARPDRPARRASSRETAPAAQPQSRSARRPCRRRVETRLPARAPARPPWARKSRSFCASGGPTRTQSGSSSRA